MSIYLSLNGDTALGVGHDKTGTTILRVGKLFYILKHWPTFSVKDWIVNILEFAGHAVSILTTQLSHYGIKHP